MLIICFSYFFKKLPFILGMANADPFFFLRNWAIQQEFLGVSPFFFSELLDCNILLKITKKNNVVVVLGTKFGIN